MKIQPKSTTKRVHIQGLTTKKAAKKKVAKTVRHIKDCQLGDNHKDCPACKQNLALPSPKLPRGTTKKYSKDVQAAIDKYDAESKSKKVSKKFTERDIQLIDLHKHQGRLAQLQKEGDNPNLIASYKKIVKELAKELKVA